MYFVFLSPFISLFSCHLLVIWELFGHFSGDCIFPFLSNSIGVKTFLKTNKSITLKCIVVYPTYNCIKCGVWILFKIVMVSLNMCLFFTFKKISKIESFCVCYISTFRCPSPCKKGYSKRHSCIYHSQVTTYLCLRTNLTFL